jgi:hypothetical protein
MKHNIKVDYIKVEVKIDGDVHSLMMSSEGLPQEWMKADPQRELGNAATALTDMILVEAGELPFADVSAEGDTAPKISYNPAFVKKYGQKAAEEYAKEMMGKS